MATDRRVSGLRGIPADAIADLAVCEGRYGTSLCKSEWSVWVVLVRDRLEQLVQRLGVSEMPNFRQKIRKNGLSSNQLELPLFQNESLFPSIRQETIHKVKGESIDAVLALGSTTFWNSVAKAVAKEESCEDRRLA